MNRKCSCEWCYANSSHNFSFDFSTAIEYVLCIRVCRATRNYADMNSLYCCAPCKPRYRKLVDNIYPRAINEGLINMQMQKLTFYAISHPEKLERIGEYLVQRLARDLARLRFVQVKIAVEAMDQLLEACHSSPSLVQFTENHLRMVQKLLESNIPVMEQLATTSFVKFSNIEENTPSYHRQYDFFISKFSQMCHSSHDEHWKVMRCAGLRGLRGVVWKSVTDGLHPTIWERQHMDKIVPSILFNLHEGDDDSCSGEEVLTGRNAFTSLVDENERDRDDPHTLSDQCLRELMGKATFGSMRAVMDPLLKHLDLHKKWQPPPNFAISLFKAILYSIQTQNSYFVIQELINHLDTMSSSNAKIRIGIATVLSSIVNIAGTSIGPLLLSIFNSLLKHLRTSVEFQQSYSCPNKEDETTYQETLINAMGDFANALPDYQKVEMMMFTVGNIPSLNNTNESSKSSDAFLQHVLVKTLLKVATKYRTAYLATVFTDSFLATLLRLALACDPQVRLNTLYIFHTLLDRHDNIHSLIHLGCELDVSDLQLTVEKCSRADQMFIRKHTNHLLTTLYKCVVKEGEGAELEERLDAIQCILCLLCIEVGYDEMLLELFRLSLSLQDYAADPTQKISDEKRMRVHNIVAKFLNVSSQLMALPSLCQHVQQIVANRASHGPPLMNLVEGVVESSEEGEIRLRVDEMDEKSGMLFDRGVISECLKASGKDTSRLVVPFSLNLSSLMPSSASSGPSLSLSPSGWEEEEDSRGKGEKREIDVDSLDLSFDVSPPETPSMRTTRRNTTVFSLLPNKTGLPVSVQALRTMVNTPVDAVEEEKRMMEMTSSVVEQLRSRPFEDISDEICKHNEEGDIVRTVSRLLARNSESVRLSEMGRTGGARPKDIFEIQLPPSYIY